MLFLRTANFFAKYAQPRWNKLKLLRPLCRWAYRFIVETPAELSRLRGIRCVGWELANHKELGKSDGAQHETCHRRQFRRVPP